MWPRGPITEIACGCNLPAQVACPEATRYISHPTQSASPKDRPAYYMNQLKGWSMTSDPKTFRQEATAYRNARDWAKDKFIEAANRRVQEESNTLADELALEDERI
jgi:hypothetical protein